MNNEIKIGDTVDCSGTIATESTCSGGKVIQDDSIHLAVEGTWSDCASWHWVRPDQITRHVPAAPVVERTKSCGDKLASEMTVRELVTLECYKSALLTAAIAGIKDITRADILTTATISRDAIIAALDKERAK